MVVLIGSGFMSYNLTKYGAGAIPMMRVQTENPEASPMVVTAEKGGLFFVFVAIALGSVVGMGATLAIVFWLINRNIMRVRQTPQKAAKSTDTTKTADAASAAS
jgi:hypothetical protein